MRLCVLQVNELNFDLVERYLNDADTSSYPSLRKVIREGEHRHTLGEREYSDIEPWIHWTNFATGLNLAEHQIRTLGDPLVNQTSQVYEELDKLGHAVGVFGSMNSKYFGSNTGFFFPDFWSSQPVRANFGYKWFFYAARKAVINNAGNGLSFFYKIILGLGALIFVKSSTWRTILKLVIRAKNKRWSKALIFDLVCSEFFEHCSKRYNISVGFLFLNAAAHIQHHFFNNFTLAEPSGKKANPEWYCPSEIDPFWAVMDAYESIFSSFVDGDKKVLVVTGLRQTSLRDPMFYYRPKSLEEMIGGLKIVCRNTQYLMSRDFRLFFDNESQLLAAKARLSECKYIYKREVYPLFISEREQKGLSLFCSVGIAADISDGVTFRNCSLNIEDFVFVAIKNGIHESQGRLIRLGTSSVALPRDGVNLAALKNYVIEMVNEA